MCIYIWGRKSCIIIIFSYVKMCSLYSKEDQSRLSCQSSCLLEDKLLITVQMA